MAVVRVMQMSFHQVVDVIAVRNSLVSTVWPVYMASLMRLTVVLRGAAVRIAPGRADLMIINMILMGVVQVPVVKVVGVPVVPHGCVPAIGTVNVCVPLVLGASTRHKFLLFPAWTRRRFRSTVFRRFAPQNVKANPLALQMSPFANPGRFHCEDGHATGIEARG